MAGEAGPGCAVGLCRPPGPAVCSSTMSLAGQYCTIRRQNAHGIEEREVLYSWHPWAGRNVCIKEVVEWKSRGVFRCACREGPVTSTSPCGLRWVLSDQTKKSQIQPACATTQAEQRWLHSLRAASRRALKMSREVRWRSWLKWLWTEPCMAVSFWRLRICRKRSMARSRRRNG